MMVSFPIALLVVLSVLAGLPPAAMGGASPACPPTRADALGPFYTPDAPVRSSVGTGHVLSGVVRSAADCRPLAEARIEFWLASPGGAYDDDHRATVIADAQGRYRFESNFPGRYPGRPPHIHIRVSAAEHDALVTQYYPPAGARASTMDLVLVPRR